MYFFHNLMTINLETFQRIYITKVTCTDNKNQYINLGPVSWATDIGL